MKQYVLTAAQSFTHIPEHPERTARRQCNNPINFDVVYGVWTNRASMLKTIEMQEKREPHRTDWKACAVQN